MLANDLKELIAVQKEGLTLLEKTNERLGEQDEHLRRLTKTVIALARMSDITNAYLANLMVHDPKSHNEFCTELKVHVDQLKQLTEESEPKG